ncbi:MAG: hypothetical protein DI535_04920 [Citrobacter freundii]|nr:MAG: hypothetical protein DI535_04920 [Citrobacter freundii]
MKKSNKLLLGGFLFVILLITGVHVALYAKYKNGDYIVYSPGSMNRQGAMQSFPGIATVSIRNMHADIEFGDVLSVEKDPGGFTRYVQKGDSLVISAGDETSAVVNPGQIKLVLPYNVTVSGSNSKLAFKATKNKADANPVLFLNNSVVAFGSWENPIRLDHVKLVAADQSTVSIGNALINHLEVELRKSSLEDNEATIGQLSVATDSTSQLTLRSHHLLKAKITSISNIP